MMTKSTTVLSGETDFSNSLELTFHWEIQIISKRGDIYFTDDFTYCISNSERIECKSSKKKTSKSLLDFEWCHLGDFISK